MATPLYPCLLKHQFGIHVKVVTKVKSILDFMEKPKAASIDDIVKELQKATNIQQKLRDALSGSIDVEFIDDANDVDSTLETLQRIQKSDADVLAYVCLYIDDDETKNTALLKYDFPCPVVFDFCKTKATRVTKHRAIEKACNEEFGLGTSAVRKSIAKLSYYLHNYSSTLRDIISIYDDEAKINKYVKEAYEENIDIDKVKSIARSVRLEGYLGRPYPVYDAFKVKGYKSKLAKCILTEIGRNVKHSLGQKILKDIQELIDTKAFNVVALDVLKHPESEYFLVNIFLWVYDALLERLLFVFSIVTTFFIPQDINSDTWRDDIAMVMQQSLTDHRSDIVRKLDEQCQYVCRTLANPLKRELQETQNQCLANIPTSTKRYSGCKLAAGSHGINESGKKVIGLRAENFDHIHLSCEKGMDIIFDQKTIKESTTEMQQVDEYMDRKLEENDQISFELQRKLNTIVRKHTPELIQNHSNIITISTSPVTSHQKGIEKVPCIVIYCSCKGIIPLEESQFPRELDNIPVDVREGYIYFATAREFYDPIRIGCSIGALGESKAGSIGVFVKEIGTKDKYGLLTCCHVLLPSQELTDPRIRQKIRDSTVTVDVVQPSYMDDNSNKTCGRLIDAKFGNVSYNGIDTGVDYAYVQMTSRIPQTLKLPSVVELNSQEYGYTEDLEMGPPILDMGEDNAGQKVCKFGRTTEFTIGKFNSGEAVIQMEPFSGFDRKEENEKRYLKNLYKITQIRKPFLQPGDSGASVYIQNETDKKVHVIGLALGGMTYGQEYFVIPIGAVLDNIHPRINIECFPN